MQSVAFARCFPEGFANGRWVPSTSSPRYNMTLNENIAHVCNWSPKLELAARKAGSEINRPPAADPYEWAPVTPCRLPALDRQTACELLGGQRIALVGDSVLMQVFDSLALALGADTTKSTRARKARVRCGGKFARGDVEFHSFRNDLLEQLVNGECLECHSKWNMTPARNMPRTPWFNWRSNLGRRPA